MPPARQPVRRSAKSTIARCAQAPGMKYVDYYATLGVARNADLATITKAYRKLGIRW